MVKLAEDQDLAQALGHTSNKTTVQFVDYTYIQYVHNNQRSTWTGNCCVS